MMLNFQKYLWNSCEQLCISLKLMIDLFNSDRITSASTIMKE